MKRGNTKRKSASIKRNAIDAMAQRKKRKVMNLPQRKLTTRSTRNAHIIPPQSVTAASSSGKSVETGESSEEGTSIL